MAQERLGRANQVAAKAIYAALLAVKEKGGQLPWRDVLAEVQKRIDFDDWEKAVLPKTGYVRWQSIMSFFSIDCTKAGYLIKKKGIWYITPEGEAALTFGEVGLFNAARAAYRRWRDDKKRIEPTGGEEDAPEDAEEDQGLTLQDMEQLAVEGLKKQIGLKNPYEFQDLVAALLRAMGYHTPFVAPAGKDGGVDIIAYRDPLGTGSPRIKVQIKHRTNGPATVQEVRQLMGLLQKEGDVGIFVSTGNFTSDAKATARNAGVHVELIDYDRFIALWQDFYGKLSDADKSLLPLRPIFFYAPST